jgi:hypothetical protein
MYKNWDPRVFDRYIKHGLRALPIAIYPLRPVSVNSAVNPLPVTLTTPKHTVVMAYFRPNFDGFIGDVTAKGEVPFLRGLKDVAKRTQQIMYALFIAASRW